MDEVHSDDEDVEDDVEQSAVDKARDIINNIDIFARSLPPRPDFLNL